MNMTKAKTKLKSKTSHLGVMQAIDAIGINVLIFTGFLLFVAPSIYKLSSMNIAIMILLFILSIVTINITNQLLSLLPSSGVMWSLIESRKNPHSVEKIYNGSFNELLSELYEVNLQLGSKFGNKYIFYCSYYLRPNICYLVRDYGKYCTIRSNSRNICFLQRSIDLEKEFNIEVN